MSNPEPKTILVLGGTSDVAQAYSRLRANSETGFLLAGRNNDELTRVRDDLIARGASHAEVVSGEIGTPGEVYELGKAIFNESRFEIDEVFIAYGLLGKQSEQQANIAALKTTIDVNFTSVAMWLELACDYFISREKGQIVVIGSVAGDRGRQSNYIYGATKSAIERLCQGIAHRLAANRNTTITLVKPGFIDSKMTDHIEKGGPLWAKPADIAKIIDRTRKKKRQSIYAPWFWRWIMLLIRITPSTIFHKTKL